MLPVTETAAVKSSFFCIQPPSTVFQTLVLPDGRQDGASLQLIAIQLSAPALTAMSEAAADDPASSLAFVTLRRCDWREVESYDKTTCRMQGLRMAQANFVFALQPESATLRIHMHRKELPVSTSFGGAPFVLAVLLKPVGEVVVSTPFFVASKSSAAPKPTRGPPKRLRTPSDKIPTFSAAAGDEDTVNAMLEAHKRQRTAATEATTTAAARSPIEPTDFQCTFHDDNNATCMESWFLDCCSEFDAKADFFLLPE